MKRQIPSSPPSSPQVKRLKREVESQSFTSVDHVQPPGRDATPLAHRHASSPGSGGPDEKPTPDSQDEIDVDSSDEAPAPEVAAPDGPPVQYASALDALKGGAHPDLVMELAQDGAHRRVLELEQDALTVRDRWYDWFKDEPTSPPDEIPHGSELQDPLVDGSAEWPRVQCVAYGAMHQARIHRLGPDDVHPRGCAVASTCSTRS